MINLDQTTLIAYVDGELDPQTARLVEERLEHDQQARDFVEMQRHIVALSRAAFPSSHFGQTTDQLHTTLQNAARAPSPQVKPRSFGNRNFGVPLALAASFFALMIGLGGGYQYGQIQAERDRESFAHVQSTEATAMNTALNQVLENHLSGDELVWKSDHSTNTAVFTPIKTYKNQNGQYCRQYRKDVTTNGQLSTVYGVACRVAPKTWKTKYLILEEGV